jgi:tetratricopeptide (TPR) repeat protein
LEAAKRWHDIIKVTAPGLERYPRDTRLLLAHALYKHYTGDLHGSIETYDRCIEYAEETKQVDMVRIARANRAAGYQLLGNMKFAIAEYRGILSTNINDSSLHNNLGYDLRAVFTAPSRAC